MARHGIYNGSSWGIWTNEEWRLINLFNVQEKITGSIYIYLLLLLLLIFNFVLKNAAFSQLKHFNKCNYANDDLSVKVNKPKTNTYINKHEV